MLIYNTIEELCKEKEISIRQLEQKIGLGNGTIGKWKKSNPSILFLRRIADYFNVPIEYFLEDEER